LALSSHSSVTISARFPSDLIAEAQRLAEIEDRSVSAVLRESLRERLQQHTAHERQPTERTAVT
jgi:predicted transcriptional regulator